jgi:Ni/Co efflux regulator RcnB
MTDTFRNTSYGLRLFVNAFPGFNALWAKEMNLAHIPEEKISTGLKSSRFIYPGVHMIKKALVFAVSAACLVSGAAFAQSTDYSRHDDRSDRYERNDRSERYQRDDRRFTPQQYGQTDGYRNDGRDSRSSRRYYDRYDTRYDNRHYGNRHDGYRHTGYGYRHSGYGYGHRDHWRRGARISHDYGQYYVVNDWHRHERLYAPQRGYHWVQTGNDYALVAIATGIIASVMLSN